MINNGGFEIYTAPIDCSAGGFDNYSVFPVNHVVNDWNIFNSPDYFTNNCSGWYSIPNNIFGSSNAKNGNAISGFEVFHKGGEVKEYIYQQLSTPLQAGKIYCLSFFISKADRKEYAVKNIGGYFSNNILSTGSIGYINANPQVVNQTGFVTDTVGWINIQGCFTANGGEQYITIGNFNSNANTDTLYVGTNNPIPSDPQYAYYYIDDITLIDQTTVGLQDMNNELGVMNVHPNPAKDVLNIETNFQTKENLTIKITDVIGREILVLDYNKQLDISFLEKGIYFVSILHGSKTLGVRKIIKE